MTRKPYEFELFKIDKGNSIKIRIVQLSDLHFPKQKISLDQLVLNLKNKNPDLIVITGDLVDGTNFNLEELSEFIKEIAKIATTYFISGNHEQKSKRENEVLNALVKEGVHDLNDKTEFFNKEGKQILLSGIRNSNQKIDSPSGNQPYNYSILLVHKPLNEKQIEHIKFLKSSYDLIICGHAHGGQIRLGKQGLYSPDQGFFPKYTSGCYKLNSFTSMIVSRGIGNGVFVPRINNKPHIPIIEINL